jgi:hypothetical protein
VLELGFREGMMSSKPAKHDEKEFVVCVGSFIVEHSVDPVLKFARNRAGCLTLGGGK